MRIISCTFMISDFVGNLTSWGIGIFDRPWLPQSQSPGRHCGEQSDKETKHINDTVQNANARQIANFIMDFSWFVLSIKQRLFAWGATQCSLLQVSAPCQSARVKNVVYITKYRGPSKPVGATATYFEVKI